MQACITCGHDAVAGTKFCRSHIASDSFSPCIGAKVEEKLNQYKDGIIPSAELKWELQLILNEDGPGPIHRHTTEKTQLKYAAKAIRKEIAKVNRILKARENVKALRSKLSDLQYMNGIKP